MKLCECGCGNAAPIARKTNAGRGHIKGLPVRFLPGHNHMGRRSSGYTIRYRPDHPRASSSGGVLEHILIAEAALGREIPPGVEVHHVDENPLNNSRGNLVICQDKAYHKLLHVRTRIVRAGGNPNTDKVCHDCGTVKPLTEFNVMRANKSTGRQSVCRGCSRARDRAKRARRSANAA